DALRTLIDAIHADPGDDTAWFAVADCLEEQGEPDRAELVRLQTRMRRTTRGADRPRWEKRSQQLLAAGVRPVVPERTLRLSARVKLRLALIPPGVFLMGSPAREPSREDDEAQHEVTIERGFYLGVYAVTQAQW